MPPTLNITYFNRRQRTLHSLHLQAREAYVGPQGVHMCVLVHVCVLGAVVIPQWAVCVNLYLTST